MVFVGYDYIPVMRYPRGQKSVAHPTGSLIPINDYENDV